MVEALVGFGGNVGDTRAILNHAVTSFCNEVDVRLLARSSDYRTPPWGVTDQSPFINLCIAIETELSPRALLDRALVVERAFGRNREQEYRWGPRTLDIDVLAYDDLAIDEPGLVLPHPRLFERAFALAPLLEIRPDLVIGGIRAGDAFQEVDTRGIERLPPL